jgi:hypothetical protein
MRYWRQTRFWMALAGAELLAFLLSALLATAIILICKLPGSATTPIGLTINVLLGYSAFRDTCNRAAYWWY